MCIVHRDFVTRALSWNALYLGRDPSFRAEVVTPKKMYLLKMVKVDTFLLFDPTKMLTRNIGIGHRVVANKQTKTKKKSHCNLLSLCRGGQWAGNTGRRLPAFPGMPAHNYRDCHTDHHGAILWTRRVLPTSMDIIPIEFLNDVLTKIIGDWGNEIGFNFTSWRWENEAC